MDPLTRLPGLLPRRWRQARRPRLWQEVVFVVVAYELYSFIRNLAPAHAGRAYANAYLVLDAERTEHLSIERSLNAAVAGVHWLSLAVDWWYATLHFVVTLGVLIWIWRRHPLRYRTARTVLLITNLVALAGYWLFPLAPPRLLPGFTDTVVRDQIWGSLASNGVAEASNQFAAMPSMHIGWSLWCGMIIISLARRPLVRVLAALYPTLTLFVIIGTANHYVLDAIGGVAALGLGLLAQRLAHGHSALRALPGVSAPAARAEDPIAA